MANNNLSHALKNGSDFYIHYEKMHIGNRSGGNATINFIQQKDQIKIQVQTQYKELFNANLNGQTIQALSDALDLTEQELIDRINKDLTDKLQDSINTQKLQKLHDIVNNVGNNGGNISQYLKDAINEQDIQKMSSALEAVAKALDLLDKANPATAAVIIDGQQKIRGLGNILRMSLNNATSFKDIGTKLTALLQKYMINNNFRLIRRQAINSAYQQLNNLAYVLEHNTFKTSGSELSAKGLSILIVNGIISTSIAEGLGFIMSGKANSILYKTILQAVGTQQVTVKSDSNKDIKITGKTDVRAKNVNITLEALDNNQNGADINMNIGISSKFYTSQQFQNLENTSLIIKSGSGGSVKEALNAIFSDDISRYLAYNYMTHNEYQQQLNDLIIKRQLLRLFATAGANTDFAQFIFINGQIVSIWDIVQYVLNSDLSLSKSLITKNSKQGVVLTIPDRRKIQQANVFEELNNRTDKVRSNIFAAWIRSKKVNAAMDATKIYAELHVANLLHSL